MTDVTSIRQEIEQLERRLDTLYGIRKAMIIEQSASMTRREIAEQWGISNPRVTGIINGGKVWRAPESPWPKG